MKLFNDPDPVMKAPTHPYCQNCGWRKGGRDSWDGNACKCGSTAPALPQIQGLPSLDQMRCDTIARLRSDRTKLIDALLAAKRHIQAVVYDDVHHRAAGLEPINALLAELGEKA